MFVEVHLSQLWFGLKTELLLHPSVIHESRGVVSPADAAPVFDFRPAPLDVSPLMGIDGALFALLNKLFEAE